LYADWKAAVPSAFKQLQDVYPDSFQFLTRAHLYSWYQKYDSQERSINALRDKRKQQNDHAHIIPKPFLEAIDNFLLQIVAAQVEVDCGRVPGLGDIF
jgi:hypothetical protein